MMFPDPPRRLRATCFNNTTSQNPAQQECTNGRSGRTKWHIYLSNGQFGRTKWSYSGRTVHIPAEWALWHCHSPVHSLTRLTLQLTLKPAHFRSFPHRCPSAPFPHPSPSHANRFWTNGTNSGRTGILPDEWARSPSGDEGADPNRSVCGMRWAHFHFDSCIAHSQSWAQVFTGALTSRALQNSQPPTNSGSTECTPLPRTRTVSGQSGTYSG